jgi:hypothetical protein
MSLSILLAINEEVVPWKLKIRIIIIYDLINSFKIVIICILLVA